MNPRTHDGRQPDGHRAAGVRARGRRGLRLALLLAGSALAGGCSFLENEFISLDRAAPSARAAMAPPPSTAARP
jgi:hypothetical protein